MFEIDAPDFSLHASLASGQSFRWKLIDGWYYGLIGPAMVRVKPADGRLLAASSDPTVGPNRIAHYFALDLNLPEVLSSINVDMQIYQAISRHRGLRVLRQDGWEALASFICASFNNIKRIEGMIERLCESYGNPVALDRVRGFTFPAAEVLARTTERRLRGLGLGYRAPYLVSTARKVADGRMRIDHLRQVDYRAAKRALMECDGVGDKVADCVALFGCEQYRAFPLDVWMHRAMRYYFRHRRATVKRMHDYAQQHFGSYAGYAQQYLYHDIRTLRAAQPPAYAAAAN
jgi:N-glycosylase/DNA lyase